MNKYTGLFLFAVFMLGSGYVYQSFYRPPGIGGVPPTGRVVDINMRVLQNQWRWEPDMLTVHAGDKIRLHIFNEDTYDHGIAVDVFGVNSRLFPRTTTVVEFTPGLPGTYNFYCSVPCGEGHYDQIGSLVVEGEEHEEHTVNPPLRVSVSTSNPSFQCPSGLPGEDSKTTAHHKGS